MLKSKLFSFLLFIFCIFSIGNLNAQKKLDEDTKNELQQVANRVAEKLKNCCSTYGGRNVYAEVDFNSVSVSKLLGEITIPTTVGWTGSWTGANYWIRGKIIINTSQGTTEWIKENDSGGFSPGCSRSCIK